MENHHNGIVEAVLYNQAWIAVVTKVSKIEKTDKHFIHNFAWFLIRKQICKQNRENYILTWNKV